MGLVIILVNALGECACAQRVMVARCRLGLLNGLDALVFRVKG
jgi:hypothetical protein